MTTRKMTYSAASVSVTTNIDRSPFFGPASLAAGPVAAATNFTPNLSLP